MEQTTQIKEALESINFHDQDENWFYYQTGSFIVSKQQFKAEIHPITDEIVPYLDDMPSNMILADYEVYLEGYARFVIDHVSFSNIELKPEQLKSVDLSIVEIGKNLEINIQLECWKSSIEIKEEWLETQY